MTEFLKGYAAGANDMEAGRLVKKEPPMSLREQLHHEVEGHACARIGANRYKERMEAAEAKLAEVEKDYESAEAQIDRLESSMARARELAEGLPEDEGITALGAETAREIARILSGDEEPTTKGDT